MNVQATPGQCKCGQQLRARLAVACGEPKIPASPTKDRYVISRPVALMSTTNCRTAAPVLFLVLVYIHERLHGRGRQPAETIEPLVSGRPHEPATADMAVCHEHEQRLVLRYQTARRMRHLHSGCSPLGPGLRPSSQPDSVRLIDKAQLRRQHQDPRSYCSQRTPGAPRTPATSVKATNGTSPSGRAPRSDACHVAKSLNHLIRRQQLIVHGDELTPVPLRCPEQGDNCKASRLQVRAPAQRASEAHGLPKDWSEKLLQPGDAASHSHSKDVPV